MIEPAAEHDIVSVPKVELHLHFGGNVEESLAIDLARRHGLDPAVVLPLLDGRYPSAYHDFPDFLRVLIAVNDVVRTPDDVEAVAAAIARGQAAQGVIYTELIVTALSHVRAGVAPRDLWAALRSGLSEGGPGTRTNIIVDAIRDDGPADLEATLQLIDDADAPIVAIALTGIEDTWPTADFAFIRDAADRRGLGVEVHAGEMGPPRASPHRSMCSAPTASDTVWPPSTTPSCSIVSSGSACRSRSVPPRTSRSACSPPSPSIPWDPSGRPASTCRSRATIRR